MSKPNCRKCKHRRPGLPGSAHSRCGHPKVKGIGDDPLQALSVMGIASESAVELGIKGNATGIRGGWFCWPIDFDPTWLEACKGFDEKEETRG